MDDSVSKSVGKNPKVQKLIGKHPLLALIISVSFPVCGWIITQSFPHDGSVSVVQNSTGSNSPNLYKSTQIIQKGPRPGIRQLGDAVVRRCAEKVVTSYKFGTEDMANTGRFSVNFNFAHPYESVITRFKPRTSIDAHGGLDGQSEAAQRDKFNYTASCPELGQDCFFVDFTAPYKMDGTVTIDSAPR